MRLGTMFSVLVVALVGTAELASAQGLRDRGRGRSDADRPVYFQAGIVNELFDLPVEVGSISTVGTPGPDTESEANTNMHYVAQHVITAASLGVHFRPPAAPEFEGDVSLLLGSATTDLTMTAEEGSRFVPAGNPGSHFSQGADSDGGFAFGIQLHGGYVVNEVVYIGLDYQFFLGAGTFNNDTFFADVVDGDYTFTRHIIQVQIGGEVQGGIRPFLSLGFILYDANADLEESNNPPTPDTWDADFEPDEQFRVAAGVELTSDLFGARVDIAILPRTSVGIFVFVRI